MYFISLQLIILKLTIIGYFWAKIKMHISNIKAPKDQSSEYDKDIKKAFLVQHTTVFILTDRQGLVFFIYFTWL